MAYSHAVGDVRIAGGSNREQATMGRVFQVVSGLGLIILVVIVIMAIVALTTGYFDHTYTNPPS